MDRAVALQLTEVVAVPYEEVLCAIQNNRQLLGELIQLRCDSLMDAYSLVTSLASRDTMARLTRTPLDLAGSIGQPAGQRVEISVHPIQEELSQMVVARRERVSLGNQAEPQRAEAR